MWGRRRQKKTVEEWNVGVLKNWSDGVMEYWSTGKIEEWSTGKTRRERTMSLSHALPTLQHSTTPVLQKTSLYYRTPAIQFGTSVAEQSHARPSSGRRLHALRARPG